MGKWIDDLHPRIGNFVVLLVAFGIGRWGYPQSVRAVLILGAVILIVRIFMNLPGMAASILKALL